MSTKETTAGRKRDGNEAETKPKPRLWHPLLPSYHGAWRVQFDDGIWSVVDDLGEVAGNIQHAEAANLIAAAQELVATAEALLEVVNVRIDDPRTAQFDALRAALAKAKGVAV